MTVIFNKRRETPKRQILRNQMPSAEVVLWSRLKGKQFLGYKFRRQYSVGPYVVDFYCPHVKLAIELDGDSHFIDDAPTYDKERQLFIEESGIRFLRFTNQEVRENLLGVLEAMKKAILAIPNYPLSRGNK